MKKDYFEWLNFLVVILIFTFLSGSHVQAKSIITPIIISKKILAQPSNLMDKKTPTLMISYTKDTSPSPYNPKEKINPFEPLFNDEPEINEGSLVPVIDRPGKPTVLETIELSQLRLTGIILATSGPRGLVQESTGKGHIVKVGTYIGARGGKVVSILKDKVIIEEKMKDFSGKIVVEQIEIKIIKHTEKI